MCYLQPYQTSTRTGALGHSGCVILFHIISQTARVLGKKDKFRIAGLQAQIIYIRHFRVCNLYVYIFVTSIGLLVIVWFYLIGCKVWLVGTCAVIF